MQLKSKSAQRFWQTFSVNREINTEFFKLVPAEQYDFRLVNTAQRKSDSIRESIAHLIAVTQNYIEGASQGDLVFHTDTFAVVSASGDYSKEQLLQVLSSSGADLQALLARADIDELKVKTPWSADAMPVTAMLYALNDHEILHTGWNLALMDALNIPRYPALIKIWGN